MITIQQFCFNAFGENTYILSDESKECIIIDPGCYEQYEQIELSNYIEQSKLRVVKLINTHCHIDHVLGNFYVKEKYNVTLGIHPQEEVILNSIPVVAQNYGFPLYAHTSHDYVLEKSVKFGKSELMCVFAPGHSPGHVMFYSKSQNFCIGGDVLFRQSIGRTDLPFGNHETLISSIKNTVFTLPDNTTIYPGHGPETTIGYEKQHNPFLN